MKETLITRGLFEAGLVKVGQRVRTRFNDEDATYDGNVTQLNGDDVYLRYDDGDEDVLYIPGFESDAEEEAKATQRLYFLEEDAALYFLLDVRVNRVLLKGVTHEALTAYVLAEYRDIGSTEHLVVVAQSDVKPVKASVAF